MGLDVIITGIVGIVSSVVSGLVSWLMARKKYNTEVASNEIDNLRKSLDFYEKIVNDNNEKLTLYIKMSEINRAEIYNLKRLVHELIDVSCLDTSCKERKFFDLQDLKAILSFDYDNENFPNIKEKLKPDEDYDDGL